MCVLFGLNYDFLTPYILRESGTVLDSHDSQRQITAVGVKEPVPVTLESRVKRETENRPLSPGSVHAFDGYHHLPSGLLRLSPDRLRACSERLISQTALKVSHGILWSVINYYQCRIIHDHSENFLAKCLIFRHLTEHYIIYRHQFLGCFSYFSLIAHSVSSLATYSILLYHA